MMKRQILALVTSTALTAPFAAHAATCTTPLTGSVTTQCDVTTDTDFTVANTGSIIRTGTARDDSGIRIDLDYSSSITNNGTIDFTATAAERYNGILIAGAATSPTNYTPTAFSGVVTNTGTINMLANLSNVATLSFHGIRLAGDNLGAGRFINSGTIDLDATITNSTDAAYVQGIRTSGSPLSGLVQNSGIINANVSLQSSGAGFRSATANGISVGFGLTSSGSVVNSGTVDVEAISNGGTTDMFTSASGITVSGVQGGTFINSGTIQANAQGNGGNTVSAYGMSTGTVANGGSVTNSGTIEASAQGTSVDYVYATGIYTLNGTVQSGGSITNSGTMNVTALAVSGVSSAVAYGFRMDVIAAGGSLINTGTILVDSSGASTNFTDAIAINTLNGNIVNSGTITATSSTLGEAYAIRALNGSGTLTNTGTMNGEIYTAGSVSVFNTGGKITQPAGAVGTINHDFTQDAAGTLAFNVASAASFGKLNIGNIATFDAGSKINISLDNGNTYNGAAMNNIITAGTLSASSFNVTDNSLRYNFAATIDGNTVDITATDTGVTSLTSALTGSGSKSGAGVAAVLDPFLNGSTAPSSSFAPLLNSLSSAVTSTSTASNTVNQLAPTLSASVGDVIMNNNRVTSRIIQSRLGSGPSVGASSQTQLMQNNLASQMDTLSPESGQNDMLILANLASGEEVSAQGEQNGAVWIKPFGSWGDQKDDTGVSGYDSSTYGAMFGADSMVNDKTRLGAAITYARSNIDSNSGTQESKINSYQGTVYGSYALADAWKVNFQGDVGMNHNESRRDITFAGLLARADYDSVSTHTGVGIETTQKISEKTTFIPSARIDYTHVRSDGYTETGAGGFNLTVDNATAQELVFGVDGKLQHPLTDKVFVEANLGAGYDVLADQNSSIASFSGGGAAFTTPGIDPSAFIGRAGLGVVAADIKGIEVSARYDGELRGEYNNHTASLKLKKPF